MILLVFKEESESIKAIVDSLKDYFKENDYMEDIRYLIIKHLSAVDSVVEIAKIRPDIMLYITFDNNINSLTNIFVCTGKNVSLESKVLQDNIVKNLNKLLSKMKDTYVFTNNNSSNYIIRLKPYPTLQMKIDSKFTNYSIIAKSIFKSIISQYKIPKINEIRLHKSSANLNMKTEPSHEGEFIVKVPKGTEFIVLECTNNTYWKIKVTIDGKEYVGYCAQQYIKLA